MKNLILLILFLSSTIAFGQTRECKKFKNGKFVIPQEEMGNTIIERKGSKQIEYAVNLGLKVEFKVVWIDDCTYTLAYKKVLENPNDLDFPKDVIISVNIIETKDNSYIQKSHSSTSTVVYESEVFRIE